MGPKINARQQRRVGRSEQHPWVRHRSPRAHPRDHPGSPRLTSAAPDGGERCRPMLTRQNGKGNVELTSPKFCPPFCSQFKRCPLRQDVYATVLRLQYIYVIVYAVNVASARTLSRPLQRPGSLPMVSLVFIITSLVAVLVPAAVTHSLPRHQHPRPPERRVGPFLSVDCSLPQRRGPRQAPCPPARILSRRSSAQCPL